MRRVAARQGWEAMRTPRRGDDGGGEGGAVVAAAASRATAGERGRMGHERRHGRVVSMMLLGCGRRFLKIMKNDIQQI